VGGRPGGHDVHEGRTAPNRLSRSPTIDVVEADPEESRRTRLTDAAFEAEYATGDHERSRAGARRNIVLRMGIIVLGTIITLAGLAALVLPGPGLVLVLIGLGILAQEVPWAERMLVYARRKAKIDKVKTQPRWVKVVLGIFSALGIAAGIAFSVVSFTGD
jgi:uncharacterized protein (TIGR02611 family)